MKTEIIHEQPEKQEPVIDWSKPMLFKSKYINLMVLSNGEHGEDFTGTAIIADGHFEVGFHSSRWIKSQFTPITEPVTIKFYPEEL